MRYPNVTWHISYLFYLFTTELWMTRPVPEHSCSSKKRITVTYNRRRLTKSGLHKLLWSTFRVYSINSYLVRSLPIHKYSLCVIYLAWFLCYWRRKPPMTLTSEFQMGHGHWKLHQWIPHVSLLISHCTRGRILYRLRDIDFDRSTIALFCYPSCV